MRTPNERLDDLEQQIEQLQRDKAIAIGAAYAAVEAALQSLKDNRVIQGVHLKCAKEAMEQSLKEKLADSPDLLEVLKYGYWPRRFGG